MDALVHVYGQTAFHDDVHIVGNYEGILKLYCALTEAIQTDQSRVDVFASDGEGYTIKVKLDRRLNMHDGKYAVPYTAEYARETREDAIFPWTKEE
jgi:hypothetical protein